MLKKSFIILLIVAVLAIIVMEKVPQRLLQYAQRWEPASQLLSTISRQELLPGPLRGSLEATQSTLTASGVIEWTNNRRVEQGLASLRMNAKLTQAAQAKLDDMFAQQYFEHVSPNGTTPANVVENAQYKYIMVGENLALGNFRNDEVLVDAWMNSPGHRANILHGRFQEIGVAVGKGEFEGKQVWLAVQEFGTPLSSCPNPSESVKSNIATNRASISNMESQLAQLKQAMEQSRYQSQAAYDSAVAQYNQLAQRLNALVQDTRTLVDEYNRGVNSFNQCLEGNGNG